MNRMGIVSGIVALAVGVGMGSSSHAATQLREVESQGGPACQLSIPTTDTKVRPKAAGFRNEGTTNAFAICSLQMPSFLSYNISISSLDGAPHETTCTATYGYSGGDMAYVTKTVSATTYHPVISWFPTDFNVVGNPDGYLSITCVLPGQTSVDRLYGYYSEDVGN